jgi:APA family basic amino acid/polyamine antiporter
MDNTQEPKKSLKRNLTMFDGIIYVVGFVIGTGIFLKPSIILKSTGSSGAALLVWIFAGLISMCSALTIAELAAYIPKVGGLYDYLTELYGDIVGYLYGWVETIISSPAGTAALAIATGEFITHFLDLGPNSAKIYAIIVIIWCVIIQVISTKLTFRIQGIITVAKMLPIVGVILFGLIKGTAHDISFAQNTGIPVEGGMGVALLGALWAYDGWLNTCTLGEELINPEKNLPKSIIVGLLICMLVFVVFNIAIFNTTSMAEVVKSDNVGRDVSVKLFGNIGGDIIIAGMAIACFGSTNSQLLGGARLTYAMGKRKQLPFCKKWTRVSSKRQTPINSIIFQMVITLTFLMLGTFDTLSNMCIFIIWIFFTLGVFGVFILRKRYPRKEGLYHVPLFPVVPLLGIAGGIYLTYISLRDAIVTSLCGIALALVGLIVYYYCKRKYGEDDAAVE